MSSPEQNVTVSNAHGMPVVSLRDARAFSRGRALADEIVRQLNAGNLPDATVEQTVSMCAAAIGHYSFAAKLPQIAEIQETLNAVNPEGCAPSEVIERAQRLGEVFRSHAAKHPHTPVVDTNGSNGTSVTVGAVRGMLAGSEGHGNDWKPGAGAKQVRNILEVEYPEQDSPPRRLWRVVEAVLG